MVLETGTAVAAAGSPYRSNAADAASGRRRDRSEWNRPRRSETQTGREAAGDVADGSKATVEAERVVCCTITSFDSPGACSRSVVHRLTNTGYHRNARERWYKLL